MKHITKPLVLSVCFFFAAAGAASAANVHEVTGTKGQPNQTIGTAETGSVTPGNASTAPGSAFNPNGKAGTVYAGNQAVNSKNPKSVSQYDVAGFQQSH